MLFRCYKRTYSLLLATLIDIHYRATLSASYCSKYFLIIFKNFMSAAFPSHKEADSLLSAVQCHCVWRKLMIFNLCHNIKMAWYHQLMSYFPMLSFKENKALYFVCPHPQRQVSCCWVLSAAVRPRLRAP